MNSIQRGGLFVTALLVAALVALHSPWTGYVVETGPRVLGRIWFESTTLPVSRWTTEDPLVPWFGNVLNFLAMIVLIAVVSAVWLYLFRSPRPAGKS